MVLGTASHFSKVPRELSLPRFRTSCCCAGYTSRLNLEILNPAVSTIITPKASLLVPSFAHPHVFFGCASRRIYSQPVAQAKATRHVDTPVDSKLIVPSHLKTRKTADLGTSSTARPHIQKRLVPHVCKPTPLSELTKAALKIQSKCQKEHLIKAKTVFICRKTQSSRNPSPLRLSQCRIKAMRVTVSSTADNCEPRFKLWDLHRA